jgi:hypothetical protein
MVLAALILILSSALFCFYLQGTAQRILRRQFDREYFLTIVAANRLEFLEVRRAIEEAGASVNSLQVKASLRCDFQALTCLLKYAANLTQSYTNEERFLMLYFRVAFISLIARHALRLREKPIILKLTTILLYFANVVGKRVNALRFTDLTAFDHLLSVKSSS